MADNIQTIKRQHWQYLTRRANICFESQSLSLASKHYYRALALAYELFYIPEEYKHGIVAIVISHHNLADLYLKKSNLLLASQHLNKAHDFMLNEFYQAKCCHAKREIMKILNITKIEITKFQNAHGSMQ